MSLKKPVFSVQALKKRCFELNKTHKKSFFESKTKKVKKRCFNESPKTLKREVLD
jgi:hypothetical protein